MERFEVDTLYVDENRSVALVSLIGTGRTVVNRASDNIYEIVSGQGTFYFPQMRFTKEVGPGSIVEIPKDVLYRDEGDLVMLCTSEPAFDESAVTVVE